MSTDETELIAQIKHGDLELYRELVDRYKEPLFRHCFYILHDEATAEDMAQDTFIRAHAKLHKYDPTKAGFKTWLFTIATRLCLEQLRREKSLPLEDENTVVSNQLTPEENMGNQELHEAVAKLQPKYRMVVSLHYWHGYSYEEIAQNMNVPIGSVRGWLHRAKKQLKEALS